MNIDPLSSDLDWFGTDKDGHIGHFVTGSWGPIPKYLANNIYILEKHLEYFSNLMCIGKATLLENPQWDWSSFTTMAERGIYSYDYKVYDGPYSIIATPSNPLLIDAIETDIQRELKNILFDKICFYDFTQIQVSNLIDCVLPR